MRWNLEVIATRLLKWVKRSLSTERSPLCGFMLILCMSLTKAKYQSDP